VNLWQDDLDPIEDPERCVNVDATSTRPVSESAAAPDTSIVVGKRGEGTLGRVNTAIGLVAGAIAGVATIVMMFHVLANVVARKVFNHPLPATLEITQYWYMPVLAMLGILAAQIAMENLRADILFSRFPPAARVVLAIVTNAIAALVCLAFAWYSLDEAMENARIGQTAGISLLPIWWVGFVVPVTFALLAYVFVAQIFLPGLADPDNAESELERELGEDDATSLAEEAIPRSRSAIGGGVGGWIVLATLIAVAIGSGAVMLSDVPKETVGIAGVVMLVSLLLLRMPLALTMIIPAVVGIFAIRGVRPVEGLLGTIAYDSTASWSLTVIPMFVFMGLLIWRSGVTTDLYTAARDWLSWLPGGLAVGTNAAGAALSAVSGSTIAQVYAVARIGIPEMLRSGYRPRYVASAVISSGLTGQLIPPSILLVIYAGLAEVSVGQQLIAGVVPGLLVLVLMCALFIALAVARPALVGRGPSAVFPPNSEPVTVSTDRWRSLLNTWPVVVLIVVIVVGMFSGWVTATEVGAAAAFFSVLITLWKLPGRKGLKALAVATVDTVRSSGALFFILIGGYSLTAMLTLSGVTKELAQTVIDANLTPIAFLLIMMVVYLVMGMFLDSLAMMLLTVPILLPTLAAMDISPLWFGVFIAFLGELAIIIPPNAMLLFIVHGIAKAKEVNQGVRFSLTDVFVGVSWVLPVAVLFLVLLIVFPQIALFLPDLMAQIAAGTSG